MHVLEHDLLSREQTRLAPRLERLLRAVDGGYEFLVGGLRDARDEVVGGGVVQVDPLRGGGVDELVVEEVLGVWGGGDFLVGGRVRG